MRAIVSVVCIISLCLLSCKDEEPASATARLLDTSVIMPLKVGNAWFYRTVMLDTIGNVLSTTYDTVSMVRDTTIGQEVWLVDNRGSCYINRPDGLWATLESGGQPARFIHLAKYPASPNDLYPLDPNLYYWLWVRVLSADSVASVPLGEFPSYVYESGGFGALFYVPGLGQVLHVRNGGYSRKELLAVHLL